MTIIGGYNPISEPASSDADLPKLKSMNSYNIKSLLKQAPSYTSDIEPSKMQNH